MRRCFSLSLQNSFGRNRNTSLIRDYVREQKVSILAWIIVGSLAQYGEALGLNKELQNFSGGPKAFAALMKPAIEAMRPLRWPADRLDTLAGYLSFHNITFFTVFLCLYAVVQGAKTVRGYEDSHVMELVLAAGTSRIRVLIDRSIGFGGTIFIISIGLGVGTGLAMAACDQPNWYGSIMIFIAAGVAAFLAFSISLCVSQLSRTHKSAAGMVTIALVILYVINNVAEEIGVVGKLRYLSPTYYANLSRPLIPGFEMHWASLGALILVSTVFIFVSARLFLLRDIGAGLLHRIQPAATPTNENFQFTPRRFWLSSIQRGWIALLSWTLGTAAFAAMLIFLEPNVAKNWEILKWLGVSDQSNFEISMQRQYIAFAASLIPPFISGYVIQHSANWVNELKQGRVEMYLSTPLSSAKLIFERVLAAAFGAVVIATASLVVLIVGASMIDLPIDTFGMFRVWVLSSACAVSMSVIACITVALVPRREAVVVLATYVTVSYVMTYIAAVLGWSIWFQRLSIFYAFGSPYQAWPSLANSAIITVMAIPGFYLATLFAERSPKTA